MTTEVAVLNRLGVALAADSAVTITGNNKSKVFDTGDKLFELCVDGTAPVGIMINGNMHLLGVPWEIIIKDFREFPRPREARSMQGWMDCLVEFITKHKTLTTEAESDFVGYVVRSEFSLILQRTLREFLRAPDSKSPLDHINAAIERRTRYYRRSRRSRNLANLKIVDVKTRHGALFRTIADDVFSDIGIKVSHRAKLATLATWLLLSNIQSDASTGIIIAGYGDGDIFPSALVTDVDGAVCGLLKHSKKNALAIDRSISPGTVVSFAQTDVIERLLSGADDRFVDESEKYIRTSLNSAKNIIAETLTNAGLQPDVAGGVLDDVIKGVVDNYKGTFVTKARQDFQNEFNQMIAMMPKQDVIELAEALVSITAIERNASSDQATVGGPVDIAFITKHEGFVWIKRKHYFEAGLNPRYFWRKKMNHLGDGHEAPGR